MQGDGQNSFPLLQKVLVNYGDRVGYADTLSEALDQVFGAGAGQSATGGGTDVRLRPATARRHPRRRRAPTASPPDTGGSPSNPAMDKAVSDISAALDALSTAQKSGDFGAQGQALADLQKAVDASTSDAQKAGGSRRPQVRPADRRGRGPEATRPLPRPGW